jgi:hypothetical protein
LASVVAVPLAASFGQPRGRPHSGSAIAISIAVPVAVRIWVTVPEAMLTA